MVFVEKRFSFFKIIIFFFLSVFILTCAGGFATASEYYWLGLSDLSGTSTGGDGVKWTDGLNWLQSDVNPASSSYTGGGTSLATSYPGSSSSGDDVAYFIKGCTVTLDKDITIDHLEIPNPNLETTSFTVTISSATADSPESLTVTNYSSKASAIETVRAAAAGSQADATSTLIFDCNLIAPSLIMHSGGNITIGSSTNQKSSANITSITNNGGDTPETLLKIEGRLISDSINMSNVTTRRLKVESNGTLRTAGFLGSEGCLSGGGTSGSGNGGGVLQITSASSGSDFSGELGKYINSSARFKQIEFFGNVSCTGSLSFSADKIIFGNLTDSTGTSPTNFSSSEPFSADTIIFGDGLNELIFSSSASVSAENIFINGSTSQSKSVTLNIKDLSASKNILCKGNENNNTSIISSASDPGISATEDFIVIDSSSTSSATFTIDSLLSARNIVIYGGQVHIKKDISASKDFIILGKDYDEKDSQTGLNLFSYLECSAAFTNITSATSANYVESQTFFTGDAVPSSYSGSLLVESGCTLSVGKNFFANGVTIPSSGAGDGSNAWKLKIKENKNVNTNFAIAVKSDFSLANCSVYGWKGSGDGTACSSSYDGLKIVAENTVVPSATISSQEPFSYGWDAEPLKILTSEDSAPAYTTSDDVICLQFNREIRNLSIENGGSQSGSQISLGLSKGYIKNYKEDGTGGNFFGLYTNAACTSSLSVGANTTKTIYIKADSDFKWNTAARGSTVKSSVYLPSFDADGSDLSGIHRTALVDFEILRAKNTEFDSNGTRNEAKSYCITDLWGKRIEHYSTRGTGSGGPGIYTQTEDKCPPALIALVLGQEAHTDYDSSLGAESQASYDAHNFLEFRYSEPVDFAVGDSSICSGNGLPAEDALGNFLEVSNIPVTATFGSLTNDITTEGSLTFAGLGTISRGKIHTGNSQSASSADPYVNALYRKDKYSIRISVAGWTYGIESYFGDLYKKWPGYIEDAIEPSGSVILPTSVSSSGNSLVKDLNGNYQSLVSSSNLPTIYVKTSYVPPSGISSGVSYYGHWDLSPPIFALLNTSTTWSEPTPSDVSNGYNAEAVGNTPGSGSTLDRIEFHFFDNTPSYLSSEPYWRTGKGWCSYGTTELYKSFSYGADIFGGSRPFESSLSERSGGGLRVCTLVQSSSLNAFSYSVIDEASTSSEKTFSSLFLGTSSAFFLGTASLPHSAGEKEGLYLSLKIPDTTLSLSTTFKVTYDETSSYITDYAGNRLRSAVIKTLDRTPPAFDITLSPVAKNKINIVFVKNLRDSISEVYYKTGSETSDPNDDTEFLSDALNMTFKSLLPYCFEIITIDDTGTACVNDSSSGELVIDTSSAAEISHITSNANGKDFTKITLSTNKNITLEDIKNCYVRVISPTIMGTTYNQSEDPITSIKSYVTFLQDEIGNYVPLNTAHAISDFAINVVSPLFASPNDMEFSDSNFSEHPWTVRNFSQDQQNYGTLPVNQSFDIVAIMQDGSENNLSLPDGIRAYFCPLPDAVAVSKQINEDLNLSLRVWLPSIVSAVYPSSVFRAFSDTNVSSLTNGSLFSLMADYSYFDDDSKILFSISKEKAVEWSKLGQVQFLFSITDGTSDSSEEIRFCSSPVYNSISQKYSTASKLPLFALRLENEADVFSLDLWSIKFKGITNQRGGITILNNVINPLEEENCVVKVNLSENARISIMVMTLDGNVVKYLEHGEVSAGEHYYTWDGKNKSGKIVARGMYFIRATGGGIDETRKVMVVK